MDGMSKNNTTGSSTSTQVVKTPDDFMDVLNDRWKIDWDLACTVENAQYNNFITEKFTNTFDHINCVHTKHPHKPENDLGSFGIKWRNLSKNYLFLNPPFCNAEPACEPDCIKPKCKKRGCHNELPQLGIARWMEKCKYESQRGAKILTLTLSSLGSQWYKNFVKGNANIWILEGRMMFDGHTDVYPKELMLCEWVKGMDSFGYWDWKVNKYGKNSLDGVTIGKQLKSTLNKLK